MQHTAMQTGSSSSMRGGGAGGRFDGCFCLDVDVDGPGRHLLQEGRDWPPMEQTQDDPGCRM